ncbi:protein yellow-like isoform X2 [Aricia agestis]|nr:protein yellow-like isoform X2 [Aricia agestis]XP_041978078.1 protein yellow-like isoform X2 [Aricia agestis]XP_041978080.1 protein yellow-like isoform X2 [Aricia agestis]
MAYGVERFFLLTYCLACCWSGARGKDSLRILRGWAELDFEFPSDADRDIAMSRRFYVPGASVPIDVDMNYRPPPQKSRMFVTIPRFDEGRPVTLGVAEDDGKISPYPDYSWHDNQGSNCDGMTSVFRVAIDKCNRLWVMDAGKIGDTARCPPQLLAFDLDTDRLVFRHKIDKAQTPTSLFITPVVDVRESCGDTYVYVADVTGYGLLVVDVMRNRSWRVTHRLFYPFPSYGTFTIDGESFDLMDGVIGMALSPYKKGYERYLYFHSLASTTENVVRTSVIRNASFIMDSNADPNSINVFPGRRPIQSAAEAMDSNGILYFGMMDPPSIWCWNSRTEYTPDNFHQIAVNQETLQFASGVKIVTNLKNQEELWILTSSFQRVMTGSMSSDRVNYRIHAEKVSNLVDKCLNHPKHQGPDYHADRISPIITNPLVFKYGAASYL